jgi:hypothetical protein
LPRRPSLVDRFRARSYRTAFAVSQVALEEVVSELPWDTFLHWTEPEIARARERFVCLAPDEYENGCEDRALLPKVLDFLAANERAFVYQEFIWGHSPEYNERTGKTNTAYYSAYVDELLSGLAARGLSDDTLIVLTSDHGFRDKSKQAERWVYHIPLWFYARRFQGSESSALLSHTDFGALLATEASLLPNTVDRPLVMVVGPTGNGMLAGITHEDELLLMRRRGPFQLLATPEDARTGKAPGPSPGELLGAFQSYRARFDAWLAH